MYLCVLSPTLPDIRFKRERERERERERLIKANNEISDGKSAAALLAMEAKKGEEGMLLIKIGVLII